MRNGKVPEVYYTRARISTERFAEEKSSARAEVIEAVRRTERELVEFCKECGALRGMANLSPGSVRFLGFRIGSKIPSDPLPNDGREVLVLRDDGRLVMVRSIDRREVQQRLVRDHEIRVENLEQFADVVQEALELHAVYMRKREEIYQRAKIFAKKLASLWD